MSARLVAALAAVGAAVLVPPAGSAPPAGAACEYVGFSPEFAHDGDALCARVLRDPGSGLLDPVTGIEVYATTDSGRTWQRRAGAGLPLPDGPSRIAQVVFSAAYATDREVVVNVAGEGLYATTDLGQSFVPRRGGGSYPDLDHLWPFMLTVKPPVQEQPPTRVPAFPYGYGGGVCFSPAGSGEYACYSSPRIITAQSAVSVVGAQDFTSLLIVPPGYPDDPPLALANAAGTKTDDYSLARCSELFVCTETLYRWPRGWHPTRFWLSPRYTTDRTMYALASDQRQVRLWRSTDGGRTFAIWAPAASLLAAVERKGMVFDAGLAVDPANPARMWLRVSGGSDTAPGEQVFATADGGARWTRVAHGLGDQQRGGRGTLPWNAATSDSGAGLLAPGGGRLFTVGPIDVKGKRAAIWVQCSVDGGRTWARTCKR